MLLYWDVGFVLRDPPLVDKAARLIAYLIFGGTFGGTSQKKIRYTKRKYCKCWTYQ